MATKVAVVTGSNRGIGFGIVRGLCKRFEGDVYLTSRNVERGQKAVAELEKEGLHPKYHQLDITDKKSVETFRDYIKNKYEGIDILVNNAGIAFKNNAPEPVSVQAERTLFVNFFSVVSSTEILIPLLKNGARMVNLSSNAGHLSNIPSKDLRERLKDEKLTVPELKDLMQQYVTAAKEGTNAAEWGNVSYVVAKVGINAFTKIQQRLLDSRDIKVNAVHAGYVNTEMASYKGPMTIDEGASAPLYLALDAPDSLRGEYVWFNKEIVEWDGQKPERWY